MTAALDRTAIARLIPHSGAMCLLDEVLAWDAATISCRTASHRESGNPLARGGQLAAICGIEYAAQAMAVHGRLVDPTGGRPVAGYLASVREVRCEVERLDRLSGDLLITAEQLLGDAARVIYRFALVCGTAPVVSGRAAVVLQAGAPSLTGTSP
jgi:predicted hotdog family 3-hydroxylacyl-ACP dehydratase